METPDPPSSILARYLRAMAVRLLVFLVLYVLSIGPMFWRWHESYNQMGRSQLWAAFYTPLLYACQFEPLGSAVNWYINLWIA